MRFSFIASCISGIVASTTLHDFRCADPYAKKQKDAKTERRTYQLRIRFFPCLIGHGLRCSLNRGRVSEIEMPDGGEVVVQFVDERNSGWDVQSNDLVTGNIIEIFHQRAQAIAV